jgi:hypothetical protein
MAAITRAMRPSSDSLNQRNSSAGQVRYAADNTGSSVHNEPIMDEYGRRPQHRATWNKGKLIGQKAPLKLKEIWAIRIRLQLARGTRDLALFNLAIDSKLRGCDLAGLRVCDIAQGGRVATRAIVIQQDTPTGSV